MADDPKAGGAAGGRGDVSRGPRVPRSFLTVAGIVGLTVFLVWLASDHSRDARAMSFADFQEHWNAKTKAYEGFDRAELHDDLLYVRPVDQEAARAGVRTAGRSTASWLERLAPRPQAKAAGREMFQRELWYAVRLPMTAFDSEFLLQLATIPGFRYESPSQLVLIVVNYILWPALILGFFYFFLSRSLRGQGGPGNVLAFGRSRPKLIAKDHTGVKFSDVAGIEEAKEEVAEVIEFLKNPAKFQGLGGRMPRGLLFVGPPGTGKTLLAKAIAGEADVPFYSISGSDFVEMFVGVGASRVRDLFRQAKENTPCIMFLDEVDAVGRRRGSGMGGGHDEREQTLNAILVEMDGFDTSDQVIVIASTNRPDVLDPALLRPGRFDREIVINLPDLKGRYEILRVHARHVKLDERVDLWRIARGTPMFSGADLEAVINEAAIAATMKGKSFVQEADLEEARDKVRFGREKRSRMLDDHDRKVTAYHEAGHAMATRLCPDVEPLHKVTIIPRGMSLGSTMMLPLKDQFTVSRRNMLGRLKVLYAGRIAEKLFCGDISSGASGDIEQATELARRMVCDFGMSDDLGPVRYASKEQHVFLGGEIQNPREYSEATAERIDHAVRAIVDACYADAERLLTDHRDDTELLAQALLKHETLSAEEVERILSAKNIDVVSREQEAKSEAAAVVA